MHTVVNIIIHDGNIYDANECAPKDFDGAVLVVDYTVEHQYDTYEGHGLHVITESYIEVEDAYLAYWLARDGEAFVYPALRFIEKPDSVRAQIFVDSKRYLWNAGIFIMPVGRLVAELERHAPRLWGALAPVAWALAAGEDPWPATVAAYDGLTSEPLDIAVMEKQRDLCVVPMAVPWTDLGSWAAMHEALPKDSQAKW